VAATALLVSAVLLNPVPAHASETYPTPLSGSWVVSGHGNGHGHGMSQYGARGAAIAGLSAAQIIAFYYSGTALATKPAATIRVQLTDAGSTTVGVPAGQLIAVSWPGGAGWSIRSSEASRVRLVPAGGGLQAQYFTTKWVNWGGQIPATQADFRSSSGVVRLYQPDGSSTDYRGVVGAVRSGGATITVNRVSLEDYLKGVVPREMPASWAPAAVQAQAIAARSYARYAIEHAGGGATDICDSTNCQVYAGMQRYDASGQPTYGENANANAAIAATANQVATYAGETIFAQFSASDGGWTADGGKPYLVAKADPYDNVASQDPWLNWQRTVSASAVASYYGLPTISNITITGRDGHGEWGGRVLEATVSGGGRTIDTTGYKLADAMGLPHNWFSLGAVGFDTRGGSVVAPTTSSVGFFYRGANNELEYRSRDNTAGWQPSQSLGAPPSGALSWDPDAATWADGHMDVVSRDSLGQLVARAFTPGSGWTAWRVYRQAGQLESSPAALSRAPGQLDVYFRGSGNTLWMMHWNSTIGWVGPTQVPGVTNALSGPDAGTWAFGTDHADIVYRGADGAIWVVSFDAARGGWQKPQRANGTHALPEPPAALDPSTGGALPGQLSIYYTAVSGRIYHSSYSAATNTWSAWYVVPGNYQATSAPDSGNQGGVNVDVAAGHNGAISAISWSAGPAGWGNWTTLPK